MPPPVQAPQVNGRPGLNPPPPPPAAPPSSLTAAATPNVAQGLDWQAAVINGVATFMANRFKQEVLQTAVTQIFDQISGQDKEVIAALFPKTYQEIVKLDAQKVYYLADLIYLQQVVQTDINSLPDRLGTTAGTIFKINPVKTDLVAIGYDLYKLNKQGFSLPDIISQLDQSKLSTVEIRQALNYLDIISSALRNTDPKSTQPWIDVTTIFPQNLNGS
jgi:hypothetical protein